MNEEVYEIISEKCSFMNIPVTVDESKRHIYPQFSSFHDLDLLTYYLFTNRDIYPEKARFHPGCDIRELMKMSPNIIQVRHDEGLTHRILDELFDGLVFHKISYPLTPNGVWKLYVANRNDYLLLLRKPYFFGNTCFTSEHNISKSQIYLYSRSEKLTTTKQLMEAIPELSNVHITKCRYENGNLLIFHIRDRSKFLQVLHLNGSLLSNTSIYNRWNQELHNDIWRLYYFVNLRSLAPFISERVSVSHYLNICYPSHITFANMLVFRPEQFKISEQEIYRIFNGIPIESVYQTDDFNWHVAFKAENFEAARFGLLPNQSTSFIYFYINHFYYESKQPIDLPFEHRVLRLSEERVKAQYSWILTAAVFQCKLYQNRQPSSIEVMNEEVYEIISEKCSFMNIPVTVDESKRHIYPQFSSFHDLDLLTYYLFTNRDIYPEKARFHPGCDIRELLIYN
ncbi:hypothetical protein RF11_01207 [Thelohanellus kitauei]|uniref:Uncharacterized protein n=1 Tax=Thelohanellus kitauei TaxID=669202 RepID=A0A0C2N6P8_THEKT|nr:hypothetical protein RF11_01207 [Thelohanellus kitauei]